MREDSRLDADFLHLLVALDETRGSTRGTPQSIASLVGYSLGKLRRESAEEIERAAIADKTARERLLQVYQTVGKFASGELPLGEVSPVQNPFGAEIAAEWLLQTGGGLLSPNRETLPAVGREADVRHLKELLGEPHSRFISLAGPGGVGKTYLLRKLAEELSAESVFLECAPIVHSTDLYVSLASQLGLEQEEDARAAIRDRLADRPLFLLLDRLDGLGHLNAEFEELLKECPSLRIVATSRQAVGLPGERIYPIRPLDIEDVDDKPAAALSLFLALAQRILRDFKTTAANLRLAREVCRLTMGVPLSMAITAGCLHEQALPDVVDTLRATVGPGTSDDGVQASVSRSLLLLSRTDRNLLRRLAIFDGQFMFEDARYICDVSDTALSDSLAHLQRCGLLAHSLGISSAIYRLHDAVEEYLGSALIPEAEQAGFIEAQCRHTEVFVKRAEGIGGLMREGQWGVGLRRLLEHNPNIRRAITRSLEREDHAAIRRFADSLCRTYFEAGFLQDFEKLGEAALQAADNLADSALRMRTLSLRGALAARMSDYETCSRLWSEKLAICREMDDVPGMADTLNDLAWEAHEQGEDDIAQAHLEEGLNLAMAAGSKELIGSNFIIRARLALANGEREQARQWVAKTEEAIAGAEDQDLLLFVEQNLILAYVGLGENRDVEDRAIRLLRKSFAGRRVIHVGWSLRQLGLAYQEGGDMERAAKCYTAAKSAYNEYRTKHVKRVETAMEDFKRAYGQEGERALLAAASIPWENLVEDLLHAE